MHTSCDYAKIIKIPRLEKGELILDFTGVDFVNTMEITELFSLCVLKQYPSKNYQVLNEDSEAVRYLQQVNFFLQLEKIKQLSHEKKNSFQNGIQDRLLELQVYNFKSAFYGDYPKITRMLTAIGLQEETVSLTASSLGELIDNAFTHNLGRWSPITGPLVVLLAQNFPKKKELCFSVCDFGVGFLATLKDNYPGLSSEHEAILHALKPNVTGRPQKKGGNGLDYLKKNVFNGFRGELDIRSGNTLVLVNTNMKPQFLSVGSGANVFFTLQYT